MKGRILTETQIAAFAVYLKSEEKSENTVEKYIRDVRAFATYVGDTEITKETVISYKGKLLSDNYAARSINSMLASINSLFQFFCEDSVNFRERKNNRTAKKRAYIFLKNVHSLLIKYLTLNG